MIICLCEAVTDRAIRDTIADGCDSVREVAEQTGAGSCCGQCACDVKKMLREWHDEHIEEPVRSK